MSLSLSVGCVEQREDSHRQLIIRPLLADDFRRRRVAHMCFGFFLCVASARMAIGHLSYTESCRDARVWLMAVCSQFDFGGGDGRDLNWKIFANGLRVSIQTGNSPSCESSFAKISFWSTWTHTRDYRRLKKIRIKIITREEEEEEVNLNEKQKKKENVKWKMPSRRTCTKMRASELVMRFACAWSVKIFIDLFCAVYFENGVARWRVHSTVTFARMNSSRVCSHTRKHTHTRTRIRIFVVVNDDFHPLFPLHYFSRERYPVRAPPFSRP